MPEFLLDSGIGEKSISYHRKAAIFSQGNPSRFVYFIASGNVKLSMISKEGREAVAGILGPGEFLGELSLAGDKTYRWTAVAITDCEVIPIDKRKMSQALHRYAEFADYFIEYLLGRKANLEGDLVDQIFSTSERRLARILLGLARHGRDRGQATPGVVPRISQETLAAMVGTTRSRISFFMNKFRRMGLLSYNGGVHVEDTLAKYLQHD